MGYLMLGILNNRGHQAVFIFIFAVLQLIYLPWRGEGRPCLILGLLMAPVLLSSIEEE